MSAPFCVTRADAIVGRCPHVVGPIAWMPLSAAWRALDHVLTWDTREGAQRFVDMNGGTVAPLGDVFGPDVL